jgi:hypothetical protein
MPLGRFAGVFLFSIWDCSGSRWGEVRILFEKREHDTQNRDILEIRNEDQVFTKVESTSTVWSRRSEAEVMASEFSNQSCDSHGKVRVGSEGPNWARG